MVSNPNSNLVFDFPDPSPRFEFNDSPRGSPKAGGGLNSLPAKKGKRFGKFGRGIGGGDKNKGSNSNSSSSKNLSLDGSSATATTGTANTSLSSTLNSSLNGSLDSLNSNIKATPSPTRLKKSHSGDIAGGPSQSQNVGVGGLNFSFDSGPSSKLNLPSHSGPSNSSGNNHRRNPSLANSATNGSTSGYISEVSEFSFDRVTVATNETGVTGHSSNVSWNFMSEDVMNAVGMAPGCGQKGSKFMPYTGDTPVALPPVANANLDNTQSRSNKKGHGKKMSHSTFDNVSLSDEEEMDNIPFTGIVNDSSSQSVISEMSERTGGALEGTANDAVKALLREGMDSARAKHHAAMKSNDRSNSLMMDNTGNDNSQDKNLGRKDSPSRETNDTEKLTDASDNDSNKSGSKDLLADIQQNYTRFKKTQRRKEKKPSSILGSIMEDVQFCGLYFCGIDTTNDETMDYGDLMKKNKNDRKRDVDDTFLGKVVQCGNDMNCGGGSMGSGSFFAAL